MKVIFIFIVLLTMKVTGQEIVEGNFYTYKSNETKIYGFVVFAIQKPNLIYMMPVTFENIVPRTTFEAITQGAVFTSEVFNAHKEKVIPGLFVFTFTESDNVFLSKLNYLGNIQLDKDKSIYGSGTGGIDEEDVMDMLKWLEGGFENHTKKPLKDFCYVTNKQ